MKKSSLAPFYLSLFIDDLAFSLVLTFFFPLLFDPLSGMFSCSFSHCNKGLTLAALLASYPLGQFIGSPFIGALADRKGRKPLLLGSLAFLALSFFLIALSIHKCSLPLLLGARFLGGLGGGNLSLSRTVISTGAKGKALLNRLAWSTVAQGAAWVIGPLIAIKLVDCHVIKWFNPAVPFYLLAACFCLSGGLIFYQWVEPEKKLTEEEASPKGLRLLLQTPKLKLALLAFLFCQIAHFFFFLGFIALESQRFQASLCRMAQIHFAHGVFFTIGCILIASASSRLRSIKPFIFYPIILLGFASYLMLFLRDRITIDLFYALFSVLGGLYFSCQLALTSSLVNPEERGKLFGLVQSCIALAQVIAPLVFNLFSGHLALPIGFAVGCYILSAVLFMAFFWFHLPTLKNSKAT